MESTLRQILAVKNGFDFEVIWISFDQSTKEPNTLIFKREDWEMLTKGFFQLSDDRSIFFSYTGGISFQASEDKSYHLKANVVLLISWEPQVSRHNDVHDVIYDELQKWKSHLSKNGIKVDWSTLKFELWIFWPMNQNIRKSLRCPLEPPFQETKIKVTGPSGFAALLGPEAQQIIKERFPRLLESDSQPEKRSRDKDNNEHPPKRHKTR